MWLAIPIAAFAVYVLIWYGPDVLARHDLGSVTGRLPVLRLQQARDAARGRLLTLGAGLVATGALLFTAQNYRLARQTLEVNERGQRRTLALTEQGQVTDRYTSAIEQLGSEKLDVRIGGIYALERIARDSARDHPTVLEVLAAFVREHSREHWPASESDDKPMPEHMTRPDIQAALTVIGRRDATNDQQPVDLHGANLASANLTGACLIRADLTDVNLTRAQLTNSHLTHANFRRADLTQANLASADLAHTNFAKAHFTRARLPDAQLINADLSYSDFTSANLAGVNLAEAELLGADLSNADLGGADLTSAQLVRANLSDARLIGAKFTNANLASAHLDGANLASANLNDANLSGAYLVRTNLIGAKLARANLFAADLTRTAFMWTDLTDVRWPRDTPVPDGWLYDPDSSLLRRVKGDGDDFE